MKKEIDISVIIPVYNTASFLHSCFDSVIKSLGSLSYEVLVMDDGSTDNSPEIIRSYLDSYDEFFYHRLDHGGQGNARNVGIMYAKGKYIHFMDSDDFLMPGIIEDMYIAAERENADVAMCNGVIFDRDKITANSYELRCFSHIGLDDRVTSLKKNPYLVWDTTMTHKLIRRDFLNKHGIRFDQIKVFEDMLPVLKVYSYAERIVTLRTRGYVYRIREDMGNTIRKVDYGYFLEKLKVVYDILNFAKEMGISDEAVSELEHKTVNGDFNYFLNNLSDFGENADNVVKKLSELIKNAISEDTKKKLPLSFKQILQDIADHDLAHLMEMVAYKNSDYREDPVVKGASGDLEIMPDENMIRISGRSADRDFAYSVPISYIRFLGRDGFRLSVTGHLYTNRFSLEKPEDQDIKAFLQNERTGKHVEIPLSRLRTEYITKIKKSQTPETPYNYDEAGFRLELDFESIAFDDDFLGKNLIVLQYKTSLFSGFRVLRGFSKDASGNCGDFRFLISDRSIAVREEMDGSMAIYISSLKDDVGIESAVRSLREKKQALFEENKLLVRTNEDILRQYQEMLWKNELHDKELEKIKKKSSDTEREYELKKQMYEAAISKAEGFAERIEKAVKKMEKIEVSVSVKNELLDEKSDRTDKLFTIMYHVDASEAPSPMGTIIKYGHLTKTKTISELGFGRPGKKFLGWRVYREFDEKWFLKDNNGKNSFKSLKNGLLPEGHSFVLYKNGEPVKRTAPEGAVHFYAQWG